MANWLTRQVDRFTPFNMPGEVQRRKKREEEQQMRQNNRSSGNSSISVGVARPTQNIVVDQPKLTVQRPENLFSDLNNSLKLPGQPKSALDIIRDQNVKPAPQAQPGQVIKPTLQVRNAEPEADLYVGKTRVKDIPDTPEVKINRGLDRGQSWQDIARENNYNVKGVEDYSKATRPDYGIKLEKPKQGIGNRFRDVFDTNTESDKYRRQEGNKKALAEGKTGEVKPLTLERQGNIVSKTPIVGTVTKMLNTAGAQIPEVGITVANQFATREYSAATKEYTDAVKSGDKTRIAKAKARVAGAADRVGDYNDQIDAAKTMYRKNDGGLFNTGTLYDEEGSRSGDIKTGLKDIALPTAVAGLDLYTLGQGAAIEQAIKESGLRVGARMAAPNIARATVGNFGSGSLDTIANDGSAIDALKAGGLNAALGLIPDVGLPALTRGFNERLLPKIMSGRSVNPTDVIDEIDDAAISASAEAANQALRPKAISIKEIRDIPVTAAEDIGTPIPVRPRPTYGRPLIKELEGDFNFPKYEELQQIRIEKQAAQANDFNAATSAPDPRVAGVLPTRPIDPYSLTPEVVKTGQDKLIDDYAGFLEQMGQGNGTQLIPDGEGGYLRTSNNYRPGMGAGRVSKAQWREEAEAQLRAGKAESAIQKEFNDAADPEVQALLAKGDQTEDAPIGRPIQIKEATSIPVRDDTVVPTGLPEKPGTVRATQQTTPMKAKSEAVANAPIVNSPAALPAEVQNVLDNPKQFNKRQVAAARNQRKLARQMAKTQEDTAEAMSRLQPNKASTGAQGEGLAPTGEFGKGKRGNAYEKASKGTEEAAGREEMKDRSVDNLLEEIGGKETFTPGDRRRMSAALETLAKTNDNPELRSVMKKLQTQSRTELGQAMAMIPRVIRKSSAPETIVNRWESKIARALDNPAKMTEKDFADVTNATKAFTDARDTAARLDEQFKRTGSESDFKAWEKAYTAARKADDDAKFTEVSVAKRVLKGEKGAHVNKVIDDLRKESNVNTMDLVTANMLSGTATGFRNTFGTELAGIENRLFANTRAGITNKLFDENVGGFSRKGARYGRKVGMVDLATDAKRRAVIGGKNPLEWAKNWSTTINSGGQSSLESQVYSRLAKYYRNNLKAEGLGGKELDMRMRHSMLSDPDEMATTYMDSAMKSSGLSGLFEKGQTIEKAVADLVGNKTDSKALQGASKLIMRLAVGFPTATANFLAQSGKRLTLGLPSYIEAGYKTFAKGDKAAGAMAFDRAMKEGGSGLAMLSLGAMLGSQGMVSGAYPEDPEERARWEREGISENSMKINGAWYPIPQGAGMFGLPILTGAAMGRDGAEGLKEMYTPKNLAKLLPTDQIQGFLNMTSGNGAPQDFKNFMASSVRASTPVGALLNQISKSTDDTKNDTTTKSLGANIMDQIYSGIPGLNQAMDIPDKTDDQGNAIQNPSPGQLFFGAASATQGKGEQRTAEIDKKISDAVNGIDQYGLLNDKNMEGVLQEKGLEAFEKLKQGKKLDEADVKALKEGLVKGVSAEGTDTAYLERGEYDTNLSVLKLKRDLMKEDKTTKPSSLKDVDMAIKRGEIYKDAEVPYDMIKDYQSVGVDEWRKMGDPESDDYDPDMYQKLWALDERMTKAGVSYAKGKPEKRKYTAKESKGKGGSRGGASASEMSTDFGKLKSGDFAPSVQQYESIDQKSGSIPVIRKVRPNIVHKIGRSG